MEVDNDPAMWVNHICKSGETLYQYNVVTGKRRWLSDISQDTTREECVSDKMDKISTSTAAKCLETLDDSVNVVNGQSLSSSSDTVWKKSAKNETIVSLYVPSQNLEIKMETDSEEEQRSIPDVLSSTAQNSQECLTNSSLEPCASVKSEKRKADPVDSCETYVIADIANSIDNSHLKRFRTGKERNTQRKIRSTSTTRRKSCTTPPGGTCGRSPSPSTLNTHPRITERNMQHKIRSYSTTRRKSCTTPPGGTCGRSPSPSTLHTHPHIAERNMQCKIRSTSTTRRKSRTKPPGGTCGRSPSPSTFNTHPHIAERNTQRKIRRISTSRQKSCTTPPGDTCEKSQTPLKCPDCLQSFSDLTAIGEHPCFKCNTCGKHLKDSKEFGDHRRAHLLEQPFKCQTCSPWLKSNLLSFLDVHSGRNEFRCADCKSVYTRSLAPSRVLLEPVARARALLLEKEFFCKSCDAWFRVESNVKLFLDIHSGRDEFVCSQCKSTYQRTNTSEGSGLKCMIPLHGNLFITPFRCPKCCPWFRVEVNRRRFLKCSKKSLFICELCNSKYTRQKTTSGGDVLVFTTVFHSRECSVCGKILNSLSDYSNHVHAHLLERRFQCLDCDVLFPQEKYLKVHSNRNHFVCSRCCRAFVRSEKQSCLLEAAFKRYHCEQCNISFAMEKVFKKHMEIHFEKVFPCPKCKNVFRTPRGLSAHCLTKHSNSSVSSNEHKCIECGKSFESSFSLRSHVLVHRKLEEIVECKECSQRFTSLSAFKFHTSLHRKYGSGKKFRCKNCYVEFQKMESLYTHSQLRCDLTSGCIFECKQCKESFDSMRKLNTHIRNHTEDLVCRHRGKEFSNSLTLAKHLKEYNFSTGQLDSRPSSNKRFTCKQCKEEFSNSKDLRKHSKLHPREIFECRYCFKQYTYYTSYEKHITIHSTLWA